MRLLYETVVVSLEFCGSTFGAPRKPRNWTVDCFLMNDAETALDARLKDLNPYPGKPRLTFKRDGTFKITVFSDLHFGENPWDDWGPEQDFNSTRLMKKVLKDENPDYVWVFQTIMYTATLLTVTCRVLNGDLITGESRGISSCAFSEPRGSCQLSSTDTFRENSTSLIDEIVAPLNAVNVPFSSSHGVRNSQRLSTNLLNSSIQNHDNQANITHLEEILREQEVAPLSYTRTAPAGVGGEGGPGNYWVPVRSFSSK